MIRWALTSSWSTEPSLPGNTSGASLAEAASVMVAVESAKFLPVRLTVTFGYLCSNCAISSFSAWDGPGEFSVSHRLIVTFFEVSKPVEPRPDAAEPPLLEPGLPQPAASTAQATAAIERSRDAREVVIGVLRVGG